MRGRVTLSEVSARIMMGASAGFCLRQLGRVGRLAGSWPSEALMAACTSRAAASIFRLKSNCRVILVDPNWLVEVIWFTPAMRPNWRSSGVATDDAMVSGLAPGNPACTLITGYSTWGRDATGSLVYAKAPAIRTPSASKDVEIGRESCRE